MKNIIVFILFCFGYISVTAQSTIETVSYQKTDHEAVVNEIPFPEKTIMNAIDTKMQQLGYKGKSSKGYTVYKAVQLAELGNDTYDLYFTADRKSRKNKDNSTLTLLISTGNDVFASETNNSTLMNNAKSYLNGIVNMIGAYDLEQQITVQQDIIDKSNKKYYSLIDDSKNLEKKRKDIEKDIENNKKDQEKQQADIEKQKSLLQNLIGQRKQ
ncbi:MAG TPA: hypothetical protein PK987_06390 [Ferruginibacter sp.]|nr:hypothetical protein [Ferruginibacter sp.]